jgi:hypothetical protein
VHSAENKLRRNPDSLSYGVYKISCMSVRSRGRYEPDRIIQYTGRLCNWAGHVQLAIEDGNTFQVHALGQATPAFSVSKEHKSKQRGNKSNLVREADALYRSHHYNLYHFLLTLSDAATGERTLEHGQSSENGVGEKSFSDVLNLLLFMAQKMSQNKGGIRKK